MRVMLRAGPWRALLGLLTAGALLGVVGQLLAGAVVTRFLQLGCLLAGVAAAFALDEPSAEVVDATPASRGRRTAVRVLPVAGGMAVVLAAWAVQGVDRVVAVELAGTTLVALAAAAVLRRRRVPEPGERIVVVLVLTLTTVVFYDPVSRRIPLFPLGPAPTSTYWIWSALGLLAVFITSLATMERRG